MTNSILQLVDELLSNQNIPSEKRECLHTIQVLLSKYCLGDCSMWSIPLLKRLNHTLLTIKQLVNGSPKNIDLIYLNILFARITQRIGNIDSGLHFPKDGPFILAQLNYEDILDQRRQDQPVYKSFNQLHEQFHQQCSSYVQKLIYLHSYVKITGISNDNIDQLITQLKLYPLTSNERNHLAQKCHPLVIPLENFVSCSTIPSNVAHHYNLWSANDNQRHFLTHNFKQKTLYDDSRDLRRLIAEIPFISSSEYNSNSPNQNQNILIDSISNVLEKYRWIVFLGDPGSAKTTLARWLTLQCAKKFCEYQRKNEQISSARLPILVRVGEIASALDRDSSLSLIDCLCQPTWFGTHLIKKHEQQPVFLQEYIENGHTLIIFDGLDEISNLRQRNHIVQLIKEFLQKWTICPITLIGPLDELVTDNPISPLLCSTTGNQVIITSRIVGYYLCPLPLYRIKHYALPPLSLPAINSFIDHWFQSVDKSLDMSTLTKSNLSTLGDQLKSMIKVNEELQKLTSNSMMLTVLCTLSLIQSQQAMMLYRTQRICLLDSLSEFTLQLSALRNEETLSLRDFLVDIALYLHERSPSGLVEELDLRNILRQSVNNNESIIHSFIHLINSETCLFVPRGLCIYGFSHLIYKEYYVCLYILRISKPDCCETLAKQFRRCALFGPRFREPLNLALGYISWKWSEKNYNALCNSLLKDADTSHFSSLVPLGSICLLSSIPELVQLPSTDILFNVLNRCIEAAAKYKWFHYFPTFVSMFQTNLNRLPSTLIHQWLHSATDNIIDAIGLFILQIGTPPSWYDQSISYRLCTELTLKNHKLSCCLYPLLAKTNRSLLPEHLICQYMLTNEIEIDKIHPLILTVLICLCGGLTRSETAENIIVFAPEFIHRHSEYSSILIENLYSDPETLLNYCHNELSSKSTQSSLDLLVICCCLEGCKDEFITWPLVQRFQQVALEICSAYSGKEYTRSLYKPNNDEILTLLSPLIDCCHQDKSSDSLSVVIVTALSRLFAVRESCISSVTFPYKLNQLNIEQLNDDLFILSKGFQADRTPATYRHLFSSRHLSLAHRVFLSAAYVIELSIDMYERWHHLSTTKLQFTIDNIQEVLTVEIAHWIHIQISIMNEQDRCQLSRVLHRCEIFTDIETANILTQWLSYSTDASLREFAYHAALLLFNLNPTATILCCQLLASELDSFRRRAEKLFRNNVISSWRLGLDGIVSLIEFGRKWTTTVAAHVLESFRTIQIRLERMYCLHYLDALLENIETCNVLESFSFIFDFSIQANFIDKLEHCHTSREDYIEIILKIFARSKGKWNRSEVNRGLTATIRLFHKYSNSIKICDSALAIFIRWKSYNYIKHIVVRSSYPQTLRIVALRWFYRSLKRISFRKIFRKLEKTASSNIKDVISEAMIYRKCTFVNCHYEIPNVENLTDYYSFDHSELFRILIILRSDGFTDSTFKHKYLPDVFTEMCTGHEFENMTTIFVNTICLGLTEFLNNPLSTLFDTHLIIAVKYIERREMEFYRAIENSVLGENGFRHALILISKKSSVSRRLAALSLLVHYGELTVDIAGIFLDFALEELSYQKSACKLIWRLKYISSKSISDYLLDKLQSESLQKRYIAALLLVQLAIHDQISTSTVCRYIKDVIHNSTSMGDIYLTMKSTTASDTFIDDMYEKGRLDQTLAILLMQFSFIAGKPSDTEYNLYKQYSSFYLKYDYLFEIIRRAPRFISYSEKIIRQTQDILDEYDYLNY